MAGTRSNLVRKEAQKLRRWADRADARVARSRRVLAVIALGWVAAAIGTLVWLAL